MPDFNPTPEQNAIVEAARDTTDNLSVVARAGAAKTSTLILVAEALPKTDILCLAFNKKIATEMSERLPSNCEAKTLHSLGYKAWFNFIRRKCNISDRKVYQLLREEIEKLEADDRKEAFDSMAETMDMIRQGKSAGWLPEDFHGHWKPLLTDFEFFSGLPMEPSGLQEMLIKKVSRNSFKESLGGNLDFDDMVLCPALCAVPWPRPSLTLIDEAQDLSPLNHFILKKLVRKNRIIAVGDPCQAIYGFRGASVNSMTELATMFSMQEYRLTISFRCARKITENAQWLASDMQSPEWAEEGQVLRPKVWSPADIELKDAIICRNNAPLFSIAIKLIEAGKLPEIAGRDLAAPLKKIMKGLGKDNQLSLAAIDALNDWEAAQLKRARDGAKGQIRDKAQCVRIMLEKTKTLGDAVAYLDHLLSRDGRIYLMTGHKSKGLEYDNVFFLDQQLCRVEKDQDANIKYVISTRAKKKLIYVTSESFQVD